jgi:hypothetical protein
MDLAGAGALQRRIAEPKATTENRGNWAAGKLLRRKTDHFRLVITVPQLA